MLRCLLLASALLIANPVLAADTKALPNLIIFLTDDQGYADVGCFGGKGIRTPNWDRMAKEGMRFTSFYVSQAVCTASRASLMTGCYCNRVGLEGALNPTSIVGISDDEVLLPELCKSKGYATALYGKWHLGHQPKFSPLRHGFDDYFGIPYPNDCSNKFHPIVRTFPPLPLIDGEKVIAEEPDQSQFTKQITERSLKFIEKNKDKPFFLYVAHIMPHVPVHASAAFQGKSQRGIYGDAIQELDHSLGQILDTLKKHGLDEKTLILFTSDNGPFLSYGDHAGLATPFRGGKLTAFEGGVRMPCIMRWPGMIPAGTDCSAIASTIDVVPTFAKLIGAELPKHPIDGKDILPLMTKPGARSPHEAFYYFAGTELHAVRQGDWKLHFPHCYLEVAGAPGKDGKPSEFDKLKPDDITKSGLEGVASRHGYKVEQLPLSLFNLKDDPGESKNVADQHADIVKKLQQLAEPIRDDLGDALQNRKGKNVRPPGKV